MKHNLKMLILAVIILAVLVGGYFFLTKWNPETEEKPLNELPTEKTEYLIDVKAKDIDFITVENGEQSYTLKNGEPASISGYSSKPIALLIKHLSDSLFCSFQPVSANCHFIFCC